MRQAVTLIQKEAWYYVRISEEHMSAFVRALRTQDTSKKLTDFGEILYSGYDNPSEELAKEMAEKYQLVSVESLFK